MPQDPALLIETMQRYHLVPIKNHFILFTPLVGFLKRRPHHPKAFKVNSLLLIITPTLIAPDAAHYSSKQSSTKSPRDLLSHLTEPPQSPLICQLVLPGQVPAAFLPWIGYWVGLPLIHHSRAKRMELDTYMRQRSASGLPELHSTTKKTWQGKESRRSWKSEIGWVKCNIAPKVWRSGSMSRQHNICSINEKKMQVCIKCFIDIIYSVTSLESCQNVIVWQGTG